MKLKQQRHLVGAIALTIAIASALPLHAAVEQRFLTVSLEDATTQLAASWSEIWQRLRRKEVPGGSRGARNQPTVCAVVPGALIDEDTDEFSSLKVWSLNPVFVWQGEWSRLEVFHSRNHQILLSQELSSEDRHLVYSDVAEAMPLEPGGAYYWKLSREGSDDQELVFGETTFRTLDEEARKELEAALADKLAGVDDPESALSQRVYFLAEQDLWADVFRELHTADELPAELEALKDEIAGHDFCQQSSVMGLAH
ncbi:MAG: hypothetical protein F6K04_11745 [Leptolyngbya sp. SIO4C5]|nr:hypothetical protein [Leptolyngbya sp. SIO4C5]